MYFLQRQCGILLLLWFLLKHNLIIISHTVRLYKTTQRNNDNWVWAVCVCVCVYCCCLRRGACIWTNQSLHRFEPASFWINNSIYMSMLFNNFKIPVIESKINVYRMLKHWLGAPMITASYRKYEKDYCFANIDQKVKPDLVIWKVFNENYWMCEKRLRDHNPIRASFIDSSQR